MNPAYAVDGILALTAAEAIALTIYHRRTSRGPPPQFLLTLLAGACLLLALRFAVTAASWHWIALALLAALAAHLADLRRRWK